jgi:hypothetical protein
MASKKKGPEPKAKENPKAGGQAGVRAGAGAPPGKGQAKGADKDASPLKRKLGLRGAAPWAARHAAKHAAEARARAAEPPLPGSARATIRTPEGAEDIKQKIRDLHGALAQIKGLRKNLHKTFFDIGTILRDIQARRLYAATGYGSFEAFLEREIDLGKTTSVRLVKLVSVFQKEAAIEHGMERTFNALAALEMIPEQTTPAKKSEVKIPPPPVSATSLPLRPPGK